MQRQHIPEVLRHLSNPAFGRRGHVQLLRQNGENQWQLSIFQSLRPIQIASCECQLHAFSQLDLIRVDSLKNVFSLGLDDASPGEASLPLRTQQFPQQLVQKAHELF